MWSSSSLGRCKKFFKASWKHCFHSTSISKSSIKNHSGNASVSWLKQNAIHESREQKPRARNWTESREQKPRAGNWSESWEQKPRAGKWTESWEQKPRAGSWFVSVKARIGRLLIVECLFICQPRLSFWGSSMSFSIPTIRFIHHLQQIFWVNWCVCSRYEQDVQSLQIGGKCHAKWKANVSTKHLALFLRQSSLQVDCWISDQNIPPLQRRFRNILWGRMGAKSATYSNIWQRQQCRY